MKFKQILFPALIIFIAVFLGANALADEKGIQYIHVGPNWAAVNELPPSQKTFRVKVYGKERYQMGDEISFSVKSKKDGRLWVVQVDSTDNMTLLFPNPGAGDNRIFSRRTLYLPPKDADWHIQATQPAGKSVVAFIVTAGGTDLTDVLSKGNNMKKALTIMENAPSWGLDKLVIDIQ